MRIHTMITSNNYTSLNKNNDFSKIKNIFRIFYDYDKFEFIITKNNAEIYTK